MIYYVRLLLFTGCVFLFQIGTPLKAQDGKTAFYRFAYSGNNLWNPGLSVQYDFPLKGEWKGDKLFKKSDQFVLLNVTSFIDPGSYAYLAAQGGIEFFNSKPGKWALSFDIRPLGYSTAFFPGSYELDGTEISGPVLLKRSYYAPGIGMGFNRGKPGLESNFFYARLGLSLLYPYNFFVMPLINIEFGCTIN